MFSTLIKSKTYYCQNTNKQITLHSQPLVVNNEMLLPNPVIKLGHVAQIKNEGFIIATP